MAIRKAETTGWSSTDAAFVALLASLTATGAAFASAPAPTGVWTWDDGRAAVEFHMCGEALCGRIVWLKQGSTPSARPTLDVKNPDPALRRRTVCGLDYITGVKNTKDGSWKSGHIYDFSSGSTYDLDIDSIDSGAIKMRVYKGVRMFGANLMLVRQHTVLPTCKSEHENN